MLRCGKCSTFTPACARCGYYHGVPSPVKHPEKLNVVIFRENTEDVYAGIEWKQGTPEAQKLIDFLNNDMLKGAKNKIREDSGIGIKPISIFGHQAAGSRWPSSTPSRTSARSSPSCIRATFMKFTEGAFRDWGYEIGDRRIPRSHRDRTRELDPRQQGQEPESDGRRECRDDRAGP